MLPVRSHFLERGLGKQTTPPPSWQNDSLDGKGQEQHASRPFSFASQRLLEFVFSEAFLSSLVRKSGFSQPVCALDDDLLCRVINPPDHQAVNRS